MANTITIARLPLLFLIVILLYAASPLAHVVAVPLLVILVAMDSLDGFVARRRHEESVLGSVLDIMVDRSVELVLWVVYAHMHLLPVAIPLLCIVRGVVVDTLRNVEVHEGQAPFQIMSTPWGKFLVGSPWMRTSYAVIKLAAFAGLAATMVAIDYRGAGSALAQSMQLVFGILSWVAVLLCVLRGAPVLIEVIGRLHNKS